MSTIPASTRVSLCLFTFADGRRCRTPRAAAHPHFCFYHAQKEAQSAAAESLAKQLSYFFSGQYLSACDLSSALGRVIPAVVRGQIKPKTARTVAYLMQTLMQTIHIAQDEYINAFSTDSWRRSVRNSVNSNYDHLRPNPSPALSPTPSPSSTPTPPPAPSPSPFSSPNPPSSDSPPSYPSQFPTPTPSPSLNSSLAPIQPPTPSSFTPSPASTPPTPPAGDATATSVSSTPFPDSDHPAIGHPEQSEGSCLDSTVPTTNEIRHRSRPARPYSRPSLLYSKRLRINTYGRARNS